MRHSNHPFFLLFTEEGDVEEITIVDAIAERQSDEDDRLLLMRCARFFSNTLCKVIVLCADGKADWSIRNGRDLIALYRKVRITSVVLVPHRLLNKRIPSYEW